MTTTHARVAMPWRIATIALLALFIALVGSVAAPREAHAIRNPTTLTSSHQGWVYVRTSGPGISSGVCTMSYPPQCKAPAATAWQWSGSEWKQTSIRTGTQVYAYPYAGGYHWIWTQATGWYAITTASLETGYRCFGYGCPVF